MAKTTTKKEEGIEILEDPDVLANKAEEFFNNKRNKNLVFGIGGVIAAVIAGFLIYKVYISNQNQEAQQEMFQAVYYFEADSLGKALNGDGINYGFLDIKDTYSGTEAANLASFYAGASYMKLGDYSSAIRNLEDFSSSDYLVQARAYALVGDANMELENYGAAVDAYEQAAGYKPNDQFTPIYLQKLAVAHEANGNFDAAAAAYGKIVDEFPNATLLQEAKKQKARLEGLAAE
ncbi:tetratricopeptide repeat protein [Marinoscillum furvescens]|uniref:Tetratricopeptide repeat protein n=1 Tax=Marinoscillum furvescens DSM 4134 TaxID=1122208 RepID=A0A3D9L2A9_MARFU|nr:tetratricopeptide repeat protein [Marinoscillum furvescens]RED98868.1 tetratricopeptide repeat protein [Marinoscillum furvescens DSM 4134]